MALRGRDPFEGRDADSLARFKQVARAIFDAVERAVPIPTEILR